MAVRVDRETTKDDDSLVPGVEAASRRWIGGTKQVDGQEREWLPLAFEAGAEAGRGSPQG